MSILIDSDTLLITLTFDFYFYYSFRHEFLAVRNGEGGFYLCQTMHNVYKSSPKIRIRWLSEAEAIKTESDSRVYKLDFYDVTDFECVLTTVDLDKMDKSFGLPLSELTRIENILKKAIDVEKGVVPRPTVTEENPDGCKYNNLVL